MTYLITVATGFIVRKLVAELLSQGNSVNYLGRRRSGDLDSRAGFHIWNAEQEPQLSSVPRLDAIIHLAGEPIAQRWTTEVKRRIYNSRVEGTRNLVNAIADLKHKPAVLVSASAVGYYGDRGEETLTEYDKPGGDFLAQLCVDWEREAYRATDFGLRVVLVRIAPALGREGGALPKMLLPFKLGLGGKFGNGQQWMSWIHLEDLVRLLIFAAENRCAAGPLNGSSPNPVTNAQFTKTLAHAVHRPAIFPAPRFVLRLALGEMSTFLLNSSRVLPRATEWAGFEFQHAELKAALADLVGSRAKLE
jgi:uncharacterized protein